MKRTNSVAILWLSFLLFFLMTGSAGATRYSLTLVTQGQGAVTPDNTNNPYSAGVNVTLTATPSNGWYFANWSGNASGSVNPLTVTMNSDLVITGNFLAYPTYAITLVTNGQGSLALNPPGGSYLSNTLVTATATPAAGWAFVAWFGATNTGASQITLAVNTNLSLTGYFVQLPAFDLQPTSLTNNAGSTVSFTSHAVGTAPVKYQWYFSGGNLMNASNATLTLTNVSSAQAGNYWVVATNNYGGATSQVASLTVTNPVGPTNIVTTPNEASLRAAIALGGWVGIGFNGTVTIGGTINITNNVVLDATGVAATISGGNAVQLFTVAQGASLTMSNLTLANGVATSSPAYGGAIYNNGMLSLVDCTLTNNTASDGIACGGAIFNNGGTVLLLDSTFVSNSIYGNAFGYGGAIYSTNGSVNMTGCALTGNVISSGWGSGASGGALYEASGAVTITGSSFFMNQALGGAGLEYVTGGPANGGAAATGGGTMYIRQSQFCSNSATGGNAGYHGTAGAGCGGAVYFTGTTTVSDSSFYGNQASAGQYTYISPIGGKAVAAYGGAVWNSGKAWLNGCSVYSNYVQGGRSVPYQNNAADGGAGLGGGIYNASVFAATNCTVALNLAAGGLGELGLFDLGPLANGGSGVGGGIYNENNSTFTGMNLTIASNACTSPFGVGCTNGLAAGFQVGNTNGVLSVHNTVIAYSGTNSNVYGPITDAGYNISSDGSAAFSSGSSYNHTDPRLAPLGNYGGWTLCMALLPDSPAIDNADPGAFPNVDQRGYVRPANGYPDTGAYEYGALPPANPVLSITPSGGNLALSFTLYPSNSCRLQWSTNLNAWWDLSTYGPVASQTNISQGISSHVYKSQYFRLLMQ